jgi:arsenate reductase-like glutaredoxin family protein
MPDTMNVQIFGIKQSNGTRAAERFADILARIGREPQLLRLPLVRSGNRLSIGRDDETWKAMAEASVR